MRREVEKVGERQIGLAGAIKDSKGDDRRKYGGPRDTKGRQMGQTRAKNGSKRPRLKILPTRYNGAATTGSNESPTPRRGTK